MVSSKSAKVYTHDRKIIYTYFRVLAECCSLSCKYLCFVFECGYNNFLAHGFLTYVAQMHSNNTQKGVIPSRAKITYIRFGLFFTRLIFPTLIILAFGTSIFTHYMNIGTRSFTRYFFNVLVHYSLKNLKSVTKNNDEVFDEQLKEWNPIFSNPHLS